MPVHDENLRYVLPATNQKSEVVLNNNFNDWQDFISMNLRHRTPGGGQRYKEGPDRKLYKRCRDHANDLRQPTDAQTTVMLTHPFYLHLTHMDIVRENESLQMEADDYLETLLGFIDEPATSREMNLVVLDTVHHYAAATSLFLEQGKIDRVIFTEYDGGDPIKDREMKEYRDNELFFGGGYNNRCLTNSIRKMNELRDDETLLDYVRDIFFPHSVHQGDMWAIKEMSLNSPQDYDTLIPSVVNQLHPSRTIGLDYALELMGRD